MGFVREKDFPRKRYLAVFIAVIEASRCSRIHI
jgi:hypothetical protein